MKIGTEVALNLSSNVIGNFDYETFFPYNLLFIVRQCFDFITFLQITHQLIKDYLKLSYLMWYW